MAVEFISGKDHYDKVVARMASVRKSLWIGTADIKDLHVKAGNSSEPFLAILAKLLKRGVEVRLIHAKEPGPAFHISSRKTTSASGRNPDVTRS